MTKKETLKLQNKGEKIFDKFCKSFLDFTFATPKTSTLELFALLEQKKEYELLIRELMKEFLSNLDNETDLFVKNGKLYKKLIYIKNLK